VKISPVDPVIALLNLKKKKEITEGKIYSPVGRFVKPAKIGPVVFELKWGRKLKLCRGSAEI